MVKAIVKEEKVEVPANVTVSIKSKVVTVSGPKGKLSRSFQSVPVQILEELDASKKVNAIVVRIWFAKQKPKSCVTTICKHIQNMITGVSTGYKYVMKYGYNILPMQPTAVDGGKTLQVTNYLGEKYIRKIKCVSGVTVVTKEGEMKKEIEVSGIDRDSVGLTCALINQNCKSKNKDKRKFRDGIYIFQRGLNE
jgi:large subunit ribosomal protein L9e